jgi:hypothetical protein
MGRGFEAGLVVAGSSGYCAEFVFISFVEDCFLGYWVRRPCASSGIPGQNRTFRTVDQFHSSGEK